MAAQDYVNVVITKDNTNDISEFTLQNVDVSVANGIRRTILSDIPCAVFKCFPYNEEQIVFYKNNTRINNEILKQRLMCVPIHIKDTSIDISKYSVVLHKKNESTQTVYVTTKDFKVIDNDTGNEISQEERDNIFPPNKITGDHIMFARLLPKYNDNVPPEEIHFKARLFYGTAAEDGAFNVASSCSYISTPNTIDQSTKWNEIEQKFKDAKMSADEIAFEKENWMLHDAKRITLQNSFDFVIESVGVFSNFELVKTACEILVNGFDKLKALAMNDELSFKNQIDENMYDVRLDNIDYTLGKVVEYYIHEMYYKKGTTLNYVGFKKPHPHDDYSILRVCFTESSDTHTSELKQIIMEACSQAKSTYEQIATYF
jgi:DNA-directed RNA polymerase alpha subunit/DNA-directed RNA polymerase subunit L